MDRYDKFLKRVDLVQNQVAREKLAEEKKSKLKKKRIQQQNAQRFAEYQQILRAELEARIFANVSSTGGESGTPFSFGNALEFDGVNDYVSIPNITFSRTSGYTISFWNKGGNQVGVLGSSLHLGFLQLINSDGRVIFNTTILGVVGNATFNFAPRSSTEWYHYFVRYNPSLNELRCYLNGIESTTGAIGVINNGSFNQIGARPNTDYIAATMDELAIWNTDIGNVASNLYNSGNGDFATNYSPANLQAYWRMNEADGATTLTDEQGTYNGTLNNFSTPPAYFIPH